MDLSGRVALVTGGAGFIGRAICQALSENGCRVIVMDRLSRGVDSQRLVDEVGPDTTYLQVDLEDEASVRAAVLEIEKEHNRLDVLVNNAAYVASNSLEGWATDFSKQDIGTWRRALEINLTSCMVICQSAASALAASGGGSIINIGSIYGSLGPDWSLYEGTSMGNPAAYAASKGGLIQLSRWLATTMAPDVRVNSVSPGGVARGQPEDFVARYKAKTPLGRMATEEDFKGIIALLASDASAYITGQDILIDGGWSAW
ncbi:MAG: SDR family oxidoreductase [Burkholderiales bacterium]|nr:SDR family oxidoreductase [Burkholderiales bacterium]